MVAVDTEVMSSPCIDNNTSYSGFHPNTELKITARDFPPENLNRQSAIAVSSKRLEGDLTHPKLSGLLDGNFNPELLKANS
ncbi:MAG: hypothetical protein F6K40_13880 [Okeania sp. SIO3I5]|uniref:hypothetical protein n=1 Tax=Okeania sp. SIO3I5 TaxID=2607805 RepID=UPI0013B7D4ED|nr:hypothetical protein [Okeania sp. SIO3I5]NEQ37297.1 hypothetical protein [Okeania sp. SIO3I5]